MADRPMAKINGNERDIPASGAPIVTTVDKAGKVIKQDLPDADGRPNIAARLLSSDEYLQRNASIERSTSPSAPA